MGDSSGDATTFEAAIPDIAAAVDAFTRTCSSLERVVLWGLCDAASAGLLYLRTSHDPRVVGMVLLNPWVRSQQSLASTHVKHYYTRRLFEWQFWAKLATGNLSVARAITEFLRTLRAARTRERDEIDSEAGYQDRMASALAEFRGPVLLVLSGQDYTAKEFVEYTATNAHWRGLLDRGNIERADLADADHTFSTAATRAAVEELTTQWIARSFGEARRCVDGG
jgi:exosortase A-associated hydrolase 1